ncbi:MAG TPA: fibronectin type III domain-containing protein [Halothiobacillus sp.]|nr:fibronectin type III domain-containing protein [Halothiobacillus sp.]
MNSIESSKGGLWHTQENLYKTFKGIALGMLLAVGLAACGGGSSTSAPAAAATVPGAPTIGAATGGNATAVVNFTAPASNGGSAITGYTVTSNPAGGVDSNAGSTVVSHLITGLTNGTSYTFTVVATNAIGASVASAASNLVTPVAPTVPGAPAIGTVTGGNAQATVQFTAPASNGNSAITSYTVTSNSGGFSATGTASPITVTGLTNGTSYTFTVVATNAVGNSAASAASNSVTPAAPTGNVPTTAAPAPSHTIVASVLTTTANDIAGTDFFPNWQQPTLYDPSPVGGVETAKYSNLSYEGIQLYNASNTAVPPVITNLDVSTATYVHFDVWTPDVTSLGLSLIAFTPPATAATSQVQVNSTLTTGQWNSIDIPLSSFTGVDLANINQLMFVGVTPGSGGTIYVQNIYFWGTAAAATIPGVPTIGTAIAGNALATVSFTAPSSNGGSTITGYTVTSNPAGGVDSNAGTTALTHTITGLTNGTPYTFTVHATNSVGSSAESTASNSVTPSTSAAFIPVVVVQNQATIGGVEVDSYTSGASANGAAVALPGNNLVGQYFGGSAAYGWGVGTGTDSVYGGVLATTTDSGDYFGLYVQGAGTTTWNIDGANSVTVGLGTNTECVGKCGVTLKLDSSTAGCSAQANTPMLVTAGGVNTGFGINTGAVTAQVTPTTYTVPLTEGNWTVSGCSTNTMAYFVTVPLKQVNALLLQANMQFTTGAPNFPNGLNLGGISFQ